MEGSGAYGTRSMTHLWRGVAQHGRDGHELARGGGAAQIAHLDGVVSGVPHNRRRAQRAVHDAVAVQACQGLHDHRQHSPLLDIIW